MKQVRGYKVFNPDWTCNNFQYEVGKTYTHKGKIGLCEAGFHFCKDLKDCFNYYSFNPENKVAQVVALGETISGDDKSVTNKIEITKELSWHEVLDLVNTGKDNTGFCNSGNWNSGNRNSGYENSGHGNSGNWNLGHGNSGNWNSGNRNSGNWNSGYGNSGNRNSGNWNSGMFNACNSANGLFNSKSPKIYMFNKPTKLTFEDFQEQYPEIYNLLKYSNFYLTKWIPDYQMTEEEKIKHPEYKVQGGYLKTFNYKEVCQKMWNSWSKTERNKIKSLPNFDKKVFKEITGIEV